MPAHAVKAVKEVPAVPRVLSSQSTWRLLITVMRPHQWPKNLFVLAPMIFGKKLGDTNAVLDSLLACITFCLLSSALYIINDIIDASADRAHPEKRLRPIASGALRVPTAAFTFIALLVPASVITQRLGTAFTLLACTYLASTLAYCLVLKRTMILDCILIACGFVLRVVAGSAAVHVYSSHWLIVCAFLLALYLAFSKRRQELLMLTDSAIHHRRVLSEYTVGYLQQVNTILLSAVLVCYALYTVSAETFERFGTDKLIYGTVFVLYGLFRYMALVQNGENGGDPGRLVVRDRPLLGAIAAWAIYNMTVIYWASIERLWNHV